MTSQFSLESPVNRSLVQIKFSIRNTGTTSFNCSDAKVSAYLNGNAPNVGGTQINSGCSAPYTLAPGGTAVYSYTYAASPALTTCSVCPGTCSDVLRVVIETGLTSSKNVNCVYVAG